MFLTVLFGAWFFGFLKINTQLTDKPGAEGQALTVFEWRAPSKSRDWHQFAVGAFLAFTLAYSAMLMASHQEVGSLPFVFWLIAMGGMIIVTMIMFVGTIISFFDGK
jgi:hypothetical protein